MTPWKFATRQMLAVMVGLAVAFSAAQVDAAIAYYKLHDHPAGNAAPPLYGLRLDGLVGGNASDVFTFSFDHADAAMFLSVNSDTDTVQIGGTAYGGRDVGGGYGTIVGLWAIDFKYNVGVTVSGDDVLVSAATGSNTGTIKFLSGSGLTVDTLFNLQDKTNGDFNFAFNDDDPLHRYPGAPDDVYAGWGWVNHEEPGGNEGHIAASDWLFTGELLPGPPGVEVPEPTTVVVWSLLSAVGMTITRRRR